MEGIEIGGQIGFDNSRRQFRLPVLVGWGRSSVGRAPQWHCGGQGFESPRLHQSSIRMKPRISAFPKCYLDQIAGSRSMSVFDWIQMARSLDADGLEMYEGFFTSLEDTYV